jgi:hypothetical protein
MKLFGCAKVEKKEGVFDHRADRKSVGALSGGKVAAFEMMYAIWRFGVLGTQADVHRIVA